MESRPRVPTPWGVPRAVRETAPDFCPGGCGVRGRRRPRGRAGSSAGRWTSEDASTSPSTRCGVQGARGGVVGVRFFFYMYFSVASSCRWVRAPGGDLNRVASTRRRTRSPSATRRHDAFASAATPSRLRSSEKPSSRAAGRCVALLTREKALCHSSTLFHRAYGQTNVPRGGVAASIEARTTKNGGPRVSAVSADDAFRRRVGGDPPFESTKRVRPTAP